MKGMNEPQQPQLLTLREAIANMDYENKEAIGQHQ